ncbi:hypothetical protein Leryth_002270 [Lithospermum erythrorhizon]|nr:hypothetical protein Leryth_002270 [Lithospermum erythrorhizon]
MLPKMASSIDQEVKILVPKMGSSIDQEVKNGVLKMGSSSCSLKRKRPPKLEIPKVLSEICTDIKMEENGTICFNAPEVGVFSCKGKKTFMEDTHKIVSFPESNKGFFGVYDGHGGSKAAEFVAKHLDSNIHKMLGNSSGNETKEEVVKAAYLKTDEEFLKQGISSGACCVTALIEEKHILVSNLGDCRAVLCRGGVAEALTKDHKAGSDEERKRIQDQGGYVDVHRGAWRVHGILAVSRSIGDAHLKNWVSAEPDTKTIHLTPDMEYLVLASDGLWEKVGNQEAVNIIMRSRSQRKRGQAIQKKNIDALRCRSPSISRRVSIVKCKRADHSPSSKNIVGIQPFSEESFSCENDSPPSKTRRVSETGQRILKLQSPRKEMMDPDIDQTKMNIQSPQAKMSVKSPQVKVHFQSPNKENSPFKVQYSSEMAPEKLRVQSPTMEICDSKTKSAMGGLVAACKELASLAVSRGSLDDITVMVVELNQFMK